jgi:hypothetical protein
LEKVDSKVPILKFSYCLDKNIEASKKCEETVDFDLMFAAVRKNTQGDYDIDGHANLLNDNNNPYSLSREQFATLTALTGNNWTLIVFMHVAIFPFLKVTNRTSLSGTFCQTISVIFALQ